jgi:hypothetical protein
MRVPLLGDGVVSLGVVVELVKFVLCGLALAGIGGRPVFPGLDVGGEVSRGKPLEFVARVLKGALGGKGHTNPGGFVIKA